jgi:hypothetical protein
LNVQIKQECTKLSNSSAISWREQVNCQWDDNEVSFVLDQHDNFNITTSNMVYGVYVKDIECPNKTRITKWPRKDTSINNLVLEWVYTKLSNSSAISWQEQVNLQWDDDEVSFVLDQHANFNLIVLTHWNYNK